MTDEEIDRLKRKVVESMEAASPERRWALRCELKRLEDTVEAVLDQMDVNHEEEEG